MVVRRVMPRALVAKEATEGFVDNGGERCIDVRELVMAGRISSSNTSATEGDCSGEATPESTKGDGNSDQIGGSNGVLALAPSSSSSMARLLAFSIEIAPRLRPLLRDLSWELLADGSATWASSGKDTICDLDDAAEFARDRNSLPRPSVVGIHREDTDGTLEPNRDNPLYGRLSERRRFGEAESV